MPALAGFGLGLSLIVAIGAQNVFVLRQGLRREHVWLVVALCAAADALLIALGVSGIGLAAAQAPWLLATVTWAGVAFLAVYGLLAARRAVWPADEALRPEAVQAPRRAAAVAATCLAITFLNPHVYLDTVFLLGSVSASYEDARWLFGLGAMAGSVVWFVALGFGARLLAPVLARPGAWRVLDGLIAVVMWALAVRVAWGG